VSKYTIKVFLTIISLIFCYVLIEYFNFSIWISGFILTALIGLISSLPIGEKTPISPLSKILIFASILILCVISSASLIEYFGSINSNMVAIYIVIIIAVTIIVIGGLIYSFKVELPPSMRD